MIYFQLPNHDKYNKKDPQGNLCVTDCGFVNSMEKWQHKRRFLEKYELIAVKKGELFLSIEKEEFTVHSGQAVILQPFFNLAGSKPSHHPVTFFWIDFSTDQNDMIAPFDRIRNIDENQDIHTLFELLSNAVRHPMNSHLQEALLLSVFHTVNGTDENNTNSECEDIIRKFIEAHSSESITAKQVAEELHYHRDYLGRMLKEQTGKTLKEYINNCKIETACMLLRTSTYSIAKIAELLGYSDSNLFTKFFVYHQGITPSLYRTYRFSTK
jgi:AraC-type DNA-binding domain-containing proteins